MIPESGRQAAHILLDTVSAFDDSDPESWPAAVKTATPRLSDVGAVTAEFDDNTDLLHVEFGPVIGAAAIVITRLIRELEHHTGQDRQSLIVWLREVVDQA